MIYEVKKDSITLDIDDNVFFDRQPAKFRELFAKLKENDSARFDNCDVLVLNNGRVIITEKMDDNGEI